MNNKEEPEKLFEIFDSKLWDSKEDIIKDVTSKLREFGYSTNDGIAPNAINVICEHGKICRIVLLDEYEEGNWILDVKDGDSIKDRCQNM